MTIGFQHEMIRSELEEVVGADHISTRETDRLVDDRPILICRKPERMF